MKKGRLMTEDNGKNRWGKWRRMWRAVSVGVMTVGVAVMGGCSPPPTKYRYLNPIWMPDGRIMVVKQIIQPVGGTGFMGTGSGSSEPTNVVLTVMNADGSNEQDVISLGRFGFISRPNCSPTGNLMATFDLNGIDIYSTITWKVVATIDTSSSTYIYEYDWSPDGQKIAVRLDSGVKLYTKDGVFIRDLTNARIIYAWKNYPYLFVDYRFGGVGSKIVGRLIDENNQIISENVEAGVPQEFLPGGQAYISASFTSKIQTSDFTEVADYREFKASLGKVYGDILPNPTNPNQVLYSDDEYISDQRGILLINLDGTGKIRLR